MSRKRRTIALVINVLIAVMVAASWGSMMLGNGIESLTARGLWSLKYFTVLSNLLLGAAAIVYAVAQARCLQGRTSEVPRAVHVLKYVSTAAVGLTFLTVMVFLGPLLGYGPMFAGANLWLHLICPLAGIIEFCVLDGPHALSMRDNLLAVVPTLVYGVCYVANILINGVGEGMSTNDWYGFTMWGVDKIPLVLAVMLLVTFLIGLAIRMANKRIALRNRPFVTHRG